MLASDTGGLQSAIVVQQVGARGAGLWSTLHETSQRCKRAGMHHVSLFRSRMYLPFAISIA